MSHISLDNIRKKNNKIEYEFSFSDNLAKYFSGKPFWIEYPENIETVPDAVAAVPFVCNVLPIVWLTDSVLSVKQLDKTFYDCIPEVKKGYETMYPDCHFRGSVHIDNLVHSEVETIGKSAMLYSGGLDSVQTLVSHFDEKPMLFSIWGSDIRCDNEKGWNEVYFAIHEIAAKNNLNHFVIKSSFREFDEEWELTKNFQEKLKDNWWHGVKHGIALLGHIAPLAYCYKLAKVYIAASHCDKSTNVTCASNPIIDNFVRFCNCQVYHDGFEFNRQDKIYNLVRFAKEKVAIPLHVCWESQNGDNCCRCEKCYRTIAGILAEGDNPKKFSFALMDDTIDYMKEIVYQKKNRKIINDDWYDIQKRVIENKAILKESPYWKSLKWLEKVNFDNLPESHKKSLFMQMRSWLARFSFYRKLHDLKERKNNGQ